MVEKIQIFLVKKFEEKTNNENNLIEEGYLINYYLYKNYENNIILYYIILYALMKHIL